MGVWAVAAMLPLDFNAALTCDVTCTSLLLTLVVVISFSPALL